MFAPLSLRDFRVYLGGNFFAINAMWVQRVVIGWLAWDLTGSVFWTGIVGFALFAPTIVLAPLFGVVADRKDLRVMIAQVQVAMCSLSLVLLGARVKPRGAFLTVPRPCEVFTHIRTNCPYMAAGFSYRDNEMYWDKIMYQRML